MRRRTPGLILTLLLALASLATAAAAPAGPAAAAPVGPAAPLFTLPAGQAPELPTAVGGRLFFFTSSTSSGSALWVTDGTAAGTRQLASGLQGVGSIGSAGAVLFFFAPASAQPGGPLELWRSDGTPAGTGVVHTFAPDPGSLYGVTTSPVVGAGGLAFVAVSPMSRESGVETLFETELWRSDGTPAGTFALTGRVSWAPGGEPPSLYGDAPIDGLASVGQAALFTVRPTRAAAQLWRSDGTLAGTQLVADGLQTCGAALGPTAAGRWVFCASESQGGAALWSVGAGASDLRRVAPLGGVSSALPVGLFQGRALFQLFGPDGAFGLASVGWASSAGAAGDAEVRMTPPMTRLRGAAAIDGRGVALITTSPDGARLCLGLGDGSPAAILGGSMASWCDPRDAPGGLGGREYVSWWPDAGGLLIQYRQALWYTDGTVAGTRRILTFAAGDLGGGLGLAGETLILEHHPDAGAVELWSMPSGPAGFVQLPDVVAGPPGGEARIPLTYGTNGLGVAGATVTLTLPAGVTYLGDTSGVAPSVVGQQLTWQLPALARLEARTFDVRVGLPAGALGTSLPATAAIATAEPSADPSRASAQAAVLLADQVFLPLTPSDPALLR